MIAVIGFGWTLLALPALGRRYLTRLPPAIWSRLVAWSFGVGGALIWVGLFAMAAPTLLAGVGAHHLAEVCRRLIHDLLGGGDVGGGIAAGVLLLSLGRALWAWLRLKRERRVASVEPWVGEHHVGDDHVLVVLPASELLAMTVGGRARQVIISRGLVEALDEEELSVVIRHELAHVRGRHHRHLAVASVVLGAFGWLPLVRTSARVIRLGMERWADEEAAGPHRGSRRMLGSALMAAAGCRPQPGGAGFGDLEMAMERLRALDATPATAAPRWWYLGVGVITAGAVSSWLGSVAVVGVSVASNGLCYL